MRMSRVSVRPAYRKREALRTFAMELEVANEGTAPAHDVTVQLHVPDGVTVSDEEEGTEEPEARRVPLAPRTDLQLLTISASHADIVASSPPSWPHGFDRMVAAGPSNVSSLDIRQ